MADIPLVTAVILCTRSVLSFGATILAKGPAKFANSFPAGLWRFICIHRAIALRQSSPRFFAATCTRREPDAGSNHRRDGDPEHIYP